MPSSKGTSKGPTAAPARHGLAVDDKGNAYVGDAGNRRVRIVEPDSTIYVADAGKHQFRKLAGGAYVPKK